MSEYTGKILGVVNNMFTGELQLTLSIDQKETLVSEYDAIKDQKLSIKLGKATKKRSLDANAMLWACLQDMAAALNTDKWEVYLMMLRRYGKFSFITVSSKAVDDFKLVWRECEEVGQIETDYGPMTQLLCYYGSSTYNTAEFDRLLTGVVSEMKEMGLRLPATEDMERALMVWGKHEKSKVNSAG